MSEQGDMLKYIVRLLVKIAPWSFLLAAIKEIGWDIAVKNDEEIVQGLVIGTKEHIDSYIPEETE